MKLFTETKLAQCNQTRIYREVYFFILFFCLFVVVVVVAISWAAPAAYGGSQARG